MPDFEFGDRLAKLRKAHGYSQYQLGTLLGLSDKAVSKWETGNAKPRLETLMKLAGILGVDVNEFLEEAKVASREDRDLSVKKQELWAKAEARLKEVYGKNYPLSVRNRFMTEKNTLGSSDVIILFETVSRLKKLAVMKHEVFAVRGLASCSFVAWLLGATSINPLPAHYLCPKCHRISFRPDAKCGWDLPDERCADCGVTMVKDGHNLPFEICVCGASEPQLAVECNISEELFDKSWDMVLEFLSPFYSFKRQECCVMDGKRRSVVPKIFLYPPRDERFDRLDRIPSISDEEAWSNIGEVPSLILIPGKNRKGSWSSYPKNPQDLINPPALNRALKFFVKQLKKDLEQLANGPEGCSQEELPVLKLPGNSDKVVSFSELVDVICEVMATYDAVSPEALAEEIGAESHSVLPWSREDLWHLICRCSGMEGQIAGVAGEIVYKTRTGRYARHLTEDDRRMFSQLNLPSWFAGFVGRMDYMFPRCHNISWALELLVMLG